MVSNKELILNTAHELFLKNGYAGTSMRDITEKAEVSMGGVYAHFSNKEDIYNELFYEHHPINHFVEIAKNFKESSVEKYFIEVVRKWTEEVDFDCFKYMHIDKAEFNGAHMNHYFIEEFPKIIKPFKKYIKDNIDKKRIRNINVDMLVEYFFHTLFGTIFAAYMFKNKNKKEITSLVLESIDIFLHGVMKEGANYEK